MTDAAELVERITVTLNRYKGYGIDDSVAANLLREAALALSSHRETIARLTRELRDIDNEIGCASALSTCENRIMKLRKRDEIMAETTQRLLQQAEQRATAANSGTPRTDQVELDMIDNLRSDGIRDYPSYARGLLKLARTLELELTKCNADWNERYQRMLAVEGELADEVKSLRAFKNGVDEALNSGNGSYKP